MDIHPTIPAAAADDDDAGTGSCYTCRPIRPLGVVPLSIRIGRQLSPGQTLFLLLLLSPPFLSSSAAFHLMLYNNKQPKLIRPEFFAFSSFTFSSAHRAKWRGYYCAVHQPPPNELASLFISLSLGCVNHPALTRRWMRSTATTRIAAINIKDGNERLFYYIRMDRLRADQLAYARVFGDKQRQVIQSVCKW